MAGNTRKEENRLLVTVSNKPLENFMGEPFKLQWYDDALDKVVLRHADMVLALRTFLRTAAADGRGNVVIKNMEDSQHARSLGVAFQQAEDGALTMTLNDHKWLLAKFEESGHLAYPTDAALLLDVLKATTESRGVAPGGKEQPDAS